MKIPLLAQLNFSKISLRPYFNRLIGNLRLVIIILGLMLFLPLLYFLYNEFYLTVTAEKKIEQLNEEFADTSVNLGLLEKLEVNHKQKTSLPLKNWNGFNNLFTIQPIDNLPAPVMVDDDSDQAEFQPEEAIPLIGF